MISDEAGGSENVNGRRIAIVVIGAMPGSTPTSVPISAPMKQKPRFAGVSAVAKPVARLAKRSMRLAHVPAKALPGLDPGRILVRRQEHASPIVRLIAARSG